MRVRLMYVKRVKAKGRTYYYHAKTGERLPDDRDQRIARVIEINAGLGPGDNPRAGSFDALIAEYKASSDFLDKADTTRRDYLRHLATISETWGNFPVTSLQRKHVLALKDAGQDTPRQTNYLIQVLRLLMTFAVDREYRPDNPALRPGRLKEGDGYQPWPDHVVTAFRGAAYPRLRLAIDLLRLTAQRPQDVIAMTWAHYDGQGIAVRQKKSKKRLWLPCPLELRGILEGAPRDDMLITISLTGRPWTVHRLAQETAKVMAEIGHAGMRYTPHGLRHSAAIALAEAGCTHEQIMAVTGHDTAAMVDHYTKGARQTMMATAAVQRLDRARKRNKSENKRTGKENR